MFGNSGVFSVCVLFRDELDSLHRELEVLSEQYSQKCLENAHLNRAIEAERQALSSVERDNQELHTRNQVNSSLSDNTFTSTHPQFMLDSCLSSLVLFKARYQSL